MDQTLDGGAVKRQFSPLYRWYVDPTNPLWQRRRNAAMALTLGRDVVFPWLKAHEVDHLSYAHMGQELPIRDIVPLHRMTHAVVTALRRRGYKRGVDFVLRAAGVLWLMALSTALVAIVTLLFFQ